MKKWILIAIGGYLWRKFGGRSARPDSPRANSRAEF